MKKLISLSLLLLIAACKPAETPQQSADKAPAGPPPIPPYQKRAAESTGNRFAASQNGEALFSNRCGACHQAGGMGTNLLTKQMMMAKRPPEDGMLSNRKDLTADYVKTVVRQGKMAMPRLSRVEVTDSELKAIADYLGKADK